MSVATAAGSTVSGAILLREASRASRQWRTYGMRALFSGALMSVILLAMSLGTQAMALGTGWLSDPATYGTVGRNLFLAFAALEVLIAMLVAPLMVARAVIEEREERTLDLVVLTRLSPTQIVSAKVLSSLLLLVTIVLGATPILALVTTLGGVSVVEVVATTIDALVAMVIVGLMGGFFALFTRSQILAAGAALAWALPVFGIVPWLYVAAVADPYAATHLSPLYAPAARGWAALLPALAYLPLLVRMSRLGSNVFTMRSANVAFGRLFAQPVWNTSRWLIELGIVIGTSITIVPIAWVVCWAAAMGSIAAGGTSATVVNVAWTGGEAVLFAWTALAISCASWVYLRLGAEWTIALDAMVIAPRAATTTRRAGVAVPLVGNNPVAWRELRPRAFAAFGMALVTWLVILWGVFQSMIWMIPGGLLALAAVHAGLAWIGAAWLATSTIEQERRDGTLELLIATTMDGRRIAWGKIVGVAAPTVPLLLVAAPLFVIGLPHAGLWASFMGAAQGSGPGTADMLLLFVRGATIAWWSVAYWMFLLVFSTLVAVRVQRPRAAYGINLGVGIGAVLLPWLLGVVFQGVPVLHAFARALFPVVAVHAGWWEPLPIATCLVLAAGVMYAILGLRLRPWTAAAAARGGGGA